MLLSKQEQAKPSWSKRSDGVAALHYGEAVRWDSEDSVAGVYVRIFDSLGVCLRDIGVGAILLDRQI